MPMPHSHFCDRGGHRWQCNSQPCPCICGTPMEEGRHEDCPTELRSCPKHELGISSVEEAAAREAGAVPIRFPAKLPEKLKRQTNSARCCDAYCIWCGFGYPRYSQKAEAEHFAQNCPDAPETLRENARRRLSTSTADSRKF